MRQRWLGKLALSLGILVTGQCAFLEAETPASNIHPYPPVEPPSPLVEPDGKPALRAVGEAEAAPAASLDRPVALRDERPAVDQKIQPTGLFSNSSGSDTFAFSPAAGAAPVARPMPVGPNNGSNSNSLPMPAPVPTASPTPDVPYYWRQPPTPYPASQGASSATVVPIPSATPGTTITADPPLPPGTIVSPGIPTAPGVVPGPTSAPMVDGGCIGDGSMGNDCCPPGCCPPDCCTPGCCDANCCDGGCGWGECNNCCFGNRWFGSAEYLLWFIRSQAMPPLLTSGSVLGNPPGALGQPGTTVLFGGKNFENNPYSGLRLRGGYWFNDNHSLGIDVGGFFLGSGTNSFAASSAGVPFLSRPFLNALTGMQDIESVAAPTGLAGRFSALNYFFLYGAEANLRRNLCCGCNWFIDGFVGWRMVGLNESLSMNENLIVYKSTNPSLPVGSAFNVHDRFATSNLFNGAQIGGVGEYRFGRWSVDVRGSVALGGTQQVVNISGSTTSIAPGAVPVTSPGGLLALSSNIGPHTRGVVSMVDEIGFNLGYQFTNHIRGFVGYNFLYWTSVARPGQQIDPVVNPNLIPPVTPGGPNRPAFNFNSSDFWVQGITAGLDIRW